MVGVLAFVALMSANYVHSASCNPKAQVHQQRLANIQFAMQLSNYIPTIEEEQFVICMLPEKEDRDAFEQRVNSLRAEQARAQAQEEAQRRAAIEAHNRPASPQEQTQAQLKCENTVTGPAYDAGIAYCLSAYKANPHSRCAAGNLPCGTVDEGLCYNPYANQRCVNGQVTGVNSTFPPWAEAFLSGKIALPNGRYVFASASCDRAPPNAVIILQNSTLRYGRTLFNLVNAGGPQAFTAKTTGDGYNGTIGYDENVTVNDATSFTVSGFGMENLGRYRLCESNSVPSVTTRPTPRAAPQGAQQTSGPARPSASATTIPSASRIIDNNGNTWTVSNGDAYRNGTAVSHNDKFKLLLLVDGNVYQESSLCKWWLWDGKFWKETSNPNPGSTSACTPAQPVADTVVLERPGPEASPQERMNFCSSSAGNRSGDDRRQFMQNCLRMLPRAP